MKRPGRKRGSSISTMVDGWRVAKSAVQNPLAVRQKHHVPFIRFVVPLPLSPVGPGELYAAKLKRGVLMIRKLAVKIV